MLVGCEVCERTGLRLEDVGCRRTSTRDTPFASGAIKRGLRLGAGEAELAGVADEPTGTGILDQRTNTLVETAWGDPLDATALGEIEPWRRQLDGTGTVLAHGGEQRKGVAGRYLVAPGPAAQRHRVVRQESHIQLVIARVPCTLLVSGME